MMVNLAVAGYVEEIIFRGFLFRAMAKDNLRSAIIVSAVTFGVGHIVNLANATDTLGVLLQVCYAIIIGFMYTLIVYKGSSLWTCLANHMLVNGSSTFALEQKPFSDFVAAVFGQASADLVQVCCSVFIMVVSGSYGLWFWKKGLNNHHSRQHQIKEESQWQCGTHGGAVTGTVRAVSFAISTRAMPSEVWTQTKSSGRMISTSPSPGRKTANIR